MEINDLFRLDQRGVDLRLCIVVGSHVYVLYTRCMFDLHPSLEMRHCSVEVTGFPLVPATVRVCSSSISVPWRRPNAQECDGSRMLGRRWMEKSMCSSAAAPGRMVS